LSGWALCSQDPDKAMSVDPRRLVPGKMELWDRLKYLANDSLVYGVAAAVSKAFALITFPILTRQLSVADYGVLDLFIVSANFVVILVVFGQDSAVARYFLECPDDASRRQLASQSLAFQLVLSALVIVPVALIARFLAMNICDRPEAPRYVFLTLAQIPFLVITNFSRNLLKWTFSRTQFLVLSVGSVAATMLALLTAVQVSRVNIELVLAISLGVQALFGILGLLMIRDWLTIPRGWQRLRELIPFAAPFGVICSLAAFVPALERSLINATSGGNNVGLYAAGAKIAMLLSMLVQAFQTAWGPFALAIHKEQDAVQTYNWVLKVFTIGICVAVMVTSAAADLLIRILATKSFLGASVVVFPMAMGLAIEAIGWVTEIGSGLAKNSRYSLYSYLSFVLTATMGVYLLAPFFGMVGVAVGVLVGQVIRTLVAANLAQRAFPIPWDYRGVAAVVGITITVGFVGVFVRSQLGPIEAITWFGIGSIATGLLGWYVLFSYHERRTIISALTRRKRRLCT
jgi:O-antigen/teichoic acid export membrane protein